MKHKVNMNASNEPILMSEEGLKKFLNELQDLYLEYKKISSTPCTDYENHNWADEAINNEFVDKALESDRIHGQIEYKISQLKRIQVVESLNNSDLIDVGDTVLLSVDDDKEEDSSIIRLVGSSPDMNAEIRQASLNSPLGKAIYGQPVGAVVSYQVNQRVFKVTIVEKLNKKLAK